ncbi:amyloid beta A4 precursor protein-binding family B member 1-interacting protein isoform X2 [Ambystoma mexicanum]
MISSEKELWSQIHFHSYNYSYSPKKMDEACDDIDEMFSNLLGEMDLLTQSLGVESTLPPNPKMPSTDFNFSVGFKDPNESLNELEDNDLDALMADLLADINEAEQKAFQSKKPSSGNQQSTSLASQTNLGSASSFDYESNSPDDFNIPFQEDLPPPPSFLQPDFDLLPPPPPPPEATPQETLDQEEEESKAKADKIKLALEKMKEAKVRKLVVKVHMNDSSTKTLMVDERQTVRDVLDNLFEKTHCDCTVEWCLYEVYADLQVERFFEDHENVVKTLSDWTRDSENKIKFLQKNEKYALFKNPQHFYHASKGKNESKEMNEKNKESLLEESFCGTSVIVPELEGALYLREDGKKSWKRRYFLLRASGIYYVPKGKTKTSRDLACFIQFENVNVYYATQCKMKYKAPTDHCFVLKHPQIQKESQYIKYLCCDDLWTLHHWVTGIRIAKYGKALYDNYKQAVHRATMASGWAKLSSMDPVGPAPGGVQPNGQVHHPVTPISSTFSEAWKRAEEVKDTKQKDTSNSTVPKTASTMPRIKTTGAPSSKVPPTAPIRRSSFFQAPAAPPIPVKANKVSVDVPPEPHAFPHPPPPAFPRIPPEPTALPPPPLFANDFPPPPSDLFDPPPDFLPPPPPALTCYGGFPPPPPTSSHTSTGAPLPPPPFSAVAPPPAPPPPPKFSQSGNPPPPLPSSAFSSHKHTPLKKPLPVPPKRQGAPGLMSGEPRPAGEPPAGGGSGEPDFMSDLMKALQKKRANIS